MYIYDKDEWYLYEKDRTDILEEGFFSRFKRYI